MIVVCTICGDLIDSENIFVTKCGHLFHYKCLHTWIVRSKTCPQCRNKVTESCIFRCYPTINDGDTTASEDATVLKMRLDDINLKYGQQIKELQGNVSTLTATKTQFEEKIKALQGKLVSKESALAAQTEQILYLKTENNRHQKLAEELETHKKSLQILQGLQKVFNATVDEVDTMLEGYADVRTVATFATALKKALYESESKKTELRNRLQATRHELDNEKKRSVELQTEVLRLEDQHATLTKEYAALTNKYKNMVKNKSDTSLKCSWNSPLKQLSSPEQSFIDDTFNDTVSVMRDKPQQNNVKILKYDNNLSLNSMVKKIENADSPYLNLKQCGVLMNRPSTSQSAFIKAPHQSQKIPLPARGHELSIFKEKDPIPLKTTDFNARSKSELNISYDGLGGHANCDADKFPQPKNVLKSRNSVPKVTAKHRLKRPAGAQSIEQMLKKTKVTRN